MKKLLLLFLFAPFFSPAADWDLFQHNQKSFFRAVVDNHVNVVVQIMDSIRSNGTEDIFYFRRNLSFENAGTCYQSVYNSLPTAGPSTMTIDSLTGRNDTVFFSWWGTSLPFYFLPHSIVGQSWTITSDIIANDYDHITVTCASIQQEIFLGITDSVKTFTMQPDGVSAGQIPVNNFVMKLSKHHGLIEYVPFSLFLYHPSSYDFFSQELIGIDSAGVEYGYQQPSLHDYFHLSAADVLLWRHYVTYDNIMQPDWQEFYRDSITQVFSSADSVVYQVDVVRLDTDNVITQFSKTDTYLETDFNDLFKIPVEWTGFQDGPYLPWLMGTFHAITAWQFNDLSLTTDSLTLDTISQSYFYTQDWGLDTVNCQIQNVFDVERNFRMNTRMGVTSYCFNNFGENCFVLEGAIISGLHYGGSDLPTAINSIESQNSFTFSPNPFHTTATIKIDASFTIKDAQLKIYNTMGFLVRQEKIFYLPSYILHRGSLSDGLYFYELLTNDYKLLGTGKFIVE